MADAGRLKYMALSPVPGDRNFAADAGRYWRYNYSGRYTNYRDNQS